MIAPKTAAAITAHARPFPRCRWWADPAAGYVLVFYAAREVREIFFTPG